MANETDPIAGNVHGTDPQNLIEQIVRAKIYECRYWKEECFGLSAEALVDKAVELNHMLQIQPDKDIIVEFIKNEDYKYVRLLGAFYMRLIGRAVEVYQYLEPLYNDYRKARERLADGSFALTHIDEVVDKMLRKDHLFDISLPRIPLRIMLERSGALEPRVSAIAEEFDAQEVDEEEGAEEEDQEQLEEQKEKERQQLRNQNKERVRVRRHRSRSPRRGAEHEERRRSASPKGKRKEKAEKVPDPEDAEIAEANALRAKLGLKPLK